MGIPGACASVTHDDRASMATGHWPLHDDRPWVVGDPITAATWFEVAAADGNIAANSLELAQLVRLLLGSGELDGRRIVSEAAMARIAEPTAPGGEDIVEWGECPGAQDSRYGLGINVERIDGHVCLTHGGGMVGYASFVLADRDAGIGVAVLTNGNGDAPAAQMLARVAHQVFRAIAEGRELPSTPDPSAGLRVSELTEAMSGEFVGVSHEGAVLRISVMAGPSDDVSISSGGVSGRLMRTWSSRYVTDHPGLRTFALNFDGTCWTYGPFVLAPASPAAEASTAEDRAPFDERLSAYVGHYRCYSPWYTNFRIVARGGRLFLVAPGGVEAPGEDCELVDMTEGVFRIGADPWLPERLVAGPVVNGQAVTVTRDGCTYSRAFTP